MVWAVDKYEVLGRDVHVVAAMLALASEGIWVMGRSMGCWCVRNLYDFAMRLLISSITVICEIRKR